ncbi:MAG: phenylalanine--tRNA ligase subunit beta [Pseudomonadales bacterium]|jgi:phenylalanyl-tRNA synthetase beta chain
MIFSESWLREWVNPSLTTEELVAQITMAGLEVDGVEAAAGKFSGVIVGEIVAIEQHPDADKLKVCSVAGIGETLTQVVCGAPNARLGIKVPFATVGARLPGDFKIRKAKLRGVESFGMLCSESELEISEANEGLWELPTDAPTGADIRDYLNLDDSLIEVDLTPNRGDCLGVIGLARDVAVLNRLPLNIPEIDFIEPSHDDVMDVALYDGEACPRYASRIVKNVNVSAATPMWMQERLRRSGIRSIDPVVDVTNYVLLELGQPMHAFDLANITDGLVIRMAEADEKITLLDEQEISLKEDTLVIADHAKALAIAGIMGGLDSGVTTSTQDIVFESAHFTPALIAGKARSYGLHTDSSHRFERGVDIAMQEVAIERATQLLLAICGGEPGPIQIVEAGTDGIADRFVTLRRAKLQQYLTLELSDDEVLDILDRLGLEMTENDSEGWTFRIPTWRFDISIEVDLIEEIARIYGYNNLPTRTPQAVLEIGEADERVKPIQYLRRDLITRDYQEAISYSFVDPAVQKLIDPNISPVKLANPISNDLSVMRTSLWAGLVTALKRNINRQQGRVRLFETGLRFVPGSDHSEVIQTPTLALLAYGPRTSEAWNHTSDAVDFFSVKGDLEAILPTNEFKFVAATRDALHPGQSAEILLHGKSVGWIGVLHPETQRELDIPQRAVLVEIDLEVMLNNGLPNYSPVSKFPETRRDLAFVVDEGVASGVLCDRIRSLLGANEIFQQVDIFDVYQGKGIEKQRKSVALGLTFRHPSRTLNDEEVNDCVNNVIDVLANEFGASLRN